MSQFVVVTSFVSLFAFATHAEGDVFAVLPTEGNGGVASEAEMASRLMTIALQEQSLALAPAEKISAAVEANAVACRQSPLACARLVGAAVGASKVVASELWDQAGALELRLLIVDVRTGLEPAWQSFQAKDRAALGGVAQQAVLSLVIPAAFTGLVGVTLEPGAEILVDGVARDRTPLLSPLKLSVGRHEVEVRYGALAAWRGFVDVTMDKAQELHLCTNATAVVDDCGPVKPEGLKPLFIGGVVGVGVGAVGLVVGAIGLVVKNSALEEYKNTATIEAHDAIGSSQTLAVTGFAVGTVLVVGGVLATVASMMVE